MNRRELEDAIRKEVEKWADAEVKFAEGGKHGKAKLSFGGKMLAQPYSLTPSDGNAIVVHLGQVRRALRQLGAKRSEPEPSEAEERKQYHKPNGGAQAREHHTNGEKAKPKPSLADQLTAIADRAPGMESVADLGAGTAHPEEVIVPQSVLDAGAKLAGQTIIGTIEKGPSKQQIARESAAKIVDGIYFGLPMEVYREVPRLGASGLQDLNASPGDFWEGSWLNPDRDAEEELDDEEEAKKKVDHLVIGEAYHCARLEPDQFELRYAREPGKADFPAKGMLTSDAAVKAALKELGCQQTFTGETIPERCQRLLDQGYEGTIMPLVKAQFRETLNGRTALPGKTYDEIVRDMERIRNHAEVGPLLEDGFSEVSVFWTDKNNIQRKARFDRLAYERWIDFKTFDNPRRKRLEKAIADAVQYNRYYVTAASYLEASEAVRTAGLQIIGEATEEQRDLIARLQLKPEQQECWFVFQQKKGVPNLLAYEFIFYDVPDAIEYVWDTGATEEAKARAHDATRRPTLIYQKGLAEIDYGKRLFAMYSQVYRPGEPWAYLEARGTINDSSFNPKWLEGLYD